MSDADGRYSWEPITSAEGTGTATGTSYQSSFAGCPRRWFYGYAVPLGHLRDTTTPLAYTGMRGSLDSPALMLGTTVHAGLAAYYQSGSRDGDDSGEYDVDRAVAVMEATHQQHLHRYGDSDQATKDITAAREMLLAYHDHFGPGGEVPDYPTTRVAHDDKGKPVIEREYAVGLSNGHRYTTRFDMAIVDGGYLKVREHKTAAASWVGRRLAAFNEDVSVTALLLALDTHFPQRKVYGVEGNVLVKYRSPNSQFAAAERCITERTPTDLLVLRREAEHLLDAIDERMQEYQAHVARGGDPLDLATLDRLWPAWGKRNGQCNAYNRRCPYYYLCFDPERATMHLADFRPRGTGEITSEGDDE